MKLYGFQLLILVALPDRTGKKKMGRRLTRINADKESKNLRNHDNLRHLRSISRHILLGHLSEKISCEEVSVKGYRLGRPKWGIQAWSYLFPRSVMTLLDTVR